MITAIFVKAPATLTFATSENLFLEEMEQPDRRTPLPAGRSTVVQVGRGVFKVHSKAEVSVNAGNSSVGIAVSPEDKDGGNDPPKLLRPMAQLMPDMDATSVRRFLFSTLNSDAPT